MLRLKIQAATLKKRRQLQLHKGVTDTSRLRLAQWRKYAVPCQQAMPGRGAKVTVDLLAREFVRQIALAEPDIQNLPQRLR